MSQTRAERASTRALAFVAMLSLLALPVPSWAQERRPPTDFEQYKGDKNIVGKPITYEVPKGLTTPESLRFDRAFQQGNRCGPNGLYLMLRLRGIKVNYDDLLAKIPL